MTIPKTFYRTTKHKKPRFQFYQPGFNRGNSCWLEGEWVTVTHEQWAKREEHQILYAPILRELGKQHYRDAATPVDKMTRAQKQAWEFNSGLASFEGTQNGHIQGFRINMAGGQPKASDLAWMRKNGLKILRQVKEPNGTITDQIAGYNIPADLIDDALDEKGEPIDFWKGVVKQNQDRRSEMHQGFRSILRGDGAIPVPTFGPPGQFQGFAAMMAFHQLIKLEEEIILEEWHKRVGRPNIYARGTEAIEEYQKVRAELQELAGEQFAQHYEAQKASHNSCARTNLDNTDGHIFSYVLPKFNPDGTHEPWGDRDVPWNAG